jgi:hypothetical protein
VLPILETLSTIIPFRPPLPPVRRPLQKQTLSAPFPSGFWDFSVSLGVVQNPEGDEAARSDVLGRSEFIPRASGGIRSAALPSLRMLLHSMS